MHLTIHLHCAGLQTDRLQPRLPSHLPVGSIPLMKCRALEFHVLLEREGSYPSRRFDLELTLPIIAGIGTRAKKTPESQVSQYRNLYVGMSRPTSFLCLAVNAAWVSEDRKAALAAQGWATPICCRRAIDTQWWICRGRSTTFRQSSCNCFPRASS